MVLKTRQMQILEHGDPQGRDIREILRDAYAAGGGISGAANILGITPSAFSKWVDQLGGDIRSEVVFIPADEPQAVAS